MTEAYIYDAVRTPRGKGKSSGSLHEITSLSLATQALQAIRDRNELDTSNVDDVVLGCVSPVGEQGGDIARIAVLNAEYAETTAGVQIDRFCASGLEACNMAASKVMTGEEEADKKTITHEEFLIVLLHGPTVHLRPCREAVHALALHAGQQ